MKLTKSIRISPEVHYKLKKQTLKLNLQTFDSTIDYLLDTVKKQEKELIKTKNI